ncbi:MAG TPA: 4Fe-4S binding protein, partial [Polyangiaceae bacterium]|nr:4Fe-4S binding protein [Polyangiaceae bacterium]
MSLRSAQNSDVRRGPALGFAALLAALAAATFLLIRQGPAELLSPGALGLSHERAGLACATCHEPERRADACRSCHGEHPSNRAAHRALASAGQLVCPDCHRAHGSEGVLVEATVVPRIASARCAACHDTQRETDPAAQCFSPLTPLSLCFDEHRARGGNQVTRSGLDERAREVALRAGFEPAGSSWWGGGLELGAAFACGLFGLFFATRRGGARSATPRVGTAVAPPTVARKRLPVIDAQRCLGCSACVEVCPHDVLEVSRYVAVVARPDACCGLALCAESCPNGSLSLFEGELRKDVPRLSPTLEAQAQPGLYLAGDLTGQSLIRVALEQGALAARGVAASLAKESTASSPELIDLVIIGAGPA